MFGLVDTCGYCSDLTLGPAVDTYLAASHPNLQNSLVLINSIAYPQDLPDSVEVLATPVLGPLLIYTIPNTIQLKSLLKKVYFNDALIPQSTIEHYAGNLDKPHAKYATLTTKPGQLFGS